MTYGQPRAEDVRELVAEHRARFGARRVASPYFGGAGLWRRLVWRLRGVVRLAGSGT